MRESTGTQARGGAEEEGQADSALSGGALLEARFHTSEIMT